MTALDHGAGLQARRVQRLLALGADPRRAARDGHIPLALATTGGDGPTIAAMTEAVAAAAGDAP